MNLINKWNIIIRPVGIFILITGLAVLSSCGGGHGGGGKASWTLLIYMAGDNNLSDAATRDLEEMEAVGSKNGVKVVVQIDRETVDGVQVPAQRRLVRNGSSKVVQDLGEVNMADPDTLKAFIQWGLDRYPADRTALVLWDHGDGYQKPAVTRNAKAFPFSILEDDTDGVACCLSNVSVSQAIDETGARFDLLGFDASRMGQIDTAYEFRNAAGLLVFSEENGNENGWDYTAILNALTADPEMDAATLSDVIVQTYGEYYENEYYPSHPLVERNLTISTVQLGDTLEGLAASWDSLSGALKSGLDAPATHDETLNAVQNARESAQGFVGATCSIYIDLFDWVDKLLGEPGLTAQIIQSGMEVSAWKDSTVISEYHGEARPGATGLSSVFFKQIGSCNNFDPSYLDGTSPVAFVADTDWNEFLSDYLNELP